MKFKETICTLEPKKYAFFTTRSIIIFYDKIVWTTTVEMCLHKSCNLLLQMQEYNCFFGGFFCKWSATQEQVLFCIRDDSLPHHHHRLLTFILIGNVLFHYRTKHWLDSNTGRHSSNAITRKK